VALPLSAVELRTSRSSGPGGQHANKTESKVIATFDVEAADFLTDEEKERVVEKVGPVLRAVAQDERSQMRNREIAVERLEDKLEAALHVEVARKPTRPSRAAIARSKDAKRKRSETKRQRRALED
jgi:ribosome-associated protein